MDEGIHGITILALGPLCPESSVNTIKTISIFDWYRHWHILLFNGEISQAFHGNYNLIMDRTPPWWIYFDSLVQDCSISRALALHSCTKPSIAYMHKQFFSFRLTPYPSHNLHKIDHVISRLVLWHVLQLSFFNDLQIGQKIGAVRSEGPPVQELIRETINL